MSTFSFLATAFFRSSTESVRRIFSENGPPVNGATVSVIVVEEEPSEAVAGAAGVTVTECGLLVACLPSFEAVEVVATRVDRSLPESCKIGKIFS